jgi:hypothetical protein
MNWLEDQDVPRQLADSYCKTGWLRRLARGAYVRADDQEVEWTGAAWTMQRLLRMTVHPGGKTALELLGDAHFLPLAGGRVTLFGSPAEKLPAWFRTHDWGVRVVYTMTNLFPRGTDLGFTEFPVRDLTLRVSGRERAMLELLYLVPEKESFDEAKLLMEGQTTLRPSMLQPLLENCNSVKAKRLFLSLAESAGHAWLRKLDLARVDLGKGKRVLVKSAKGGRLDAKYQIVLPVSREESEATGERP